ncbi:MAG TPA: HlyD family type I secretion periplasmic adaptor subunit, partial [Alphaproteobacteria bacterium]|nr:HlyD family type I secretion periplasmic adaptor subunit [Alphaproteobacteria bacterium]
AGDVVLRLDATQTRATASVLQAQWISLKAREARLLAERDGLRQIRMPEDLQPLKHLPGVRQAMDGEVALFRTREQTRGGFATQLRERKSQVSLERTSLMKLSAARRQEMQFLSKELGGIQRLYARGLATTNRLVNLQRDMTRLQAEAMQFESDTLRLGGRSDEVELEILRRTAEHQTEVVDALRDIQVKLAELDERRLAAADTLAKLEVKAPQSGVVFGSIVHTVGGVVAPGQTLMRIVPEDQPLVVQARIAPRDVDQVALGSAAAVKLLAGNRRLAEPFNGKVVHVSADTARDERSGEAFFLVRISLDRMAAERQLGVRLQSGVQAEAFITTAERTVLSYLVEPLSDQFARSMRER